MVTISLLTSPGLLYSKAFYFGEKIGATRQFVGAGMFVGMKENEREVFKACAKLDDDERA